MPDMLRHSLIHIVFFGLMGLAGIVHAEPDPAVIANCQRISDKLASVYYTQCLANKLSDSKNSTALGTPLMIKEYPPLAQRRPQARILLLGGIHGDEYSSISIVFKWMNILDQHHSGLFHWKIIPLLNPDGLLRTDSRRTNGNGVDLNRNFLPADNMKASLEYWKKRTYRDPRRYPGPSPLSEPETQWITRLIDEFDPDVIVAVHAPYGILDFDGPHQAPKHLGPLHLKLLGTYPGSLGNYAGIQLGKPVITIELPHAGIMPSKTEISRIWTDLIRWLKKNVRHQQATASDEPKLKLAAESGLRK